jgi:UDP-N-acetylmuramyl pentapeptide phosphotransferase/UDP-N-acetylglucosamine-1-phosphate transferase
VNENKWIVPAVGGVLFLIGLVLVIAHLRTRKRAQNEPQLDAAAQTHLAKRFRRRLQASGMIAMLGVLIGVGDQLPILRQKPGLFGLYWLAVLLMTAWVMLLGVGDYFSTRVHGRAALTRLRKKQHALEEEVAEIRRRGSNGRDTRG